METRNENISSTEKKGLTGRHALLTVQHIRLLLRRRDCAHTRLLLSANIYHNVCMKSKSEQEGDSYPDLLQPASQAPFKLRYIDKNATTTHQQQQQKQPRKTTTTTTTTNNNTKSHDDRQHFAWQSLFVTLGKHLGRKQFILDRELHHQLVFIPSTEARVSCSLPQPRLNRSPAQLSMCQWQVETREVPCTMRVHAKPSDSARTNTDYRRY